MLFLEIVRQYTETRLPPKNDFAFDLTELVIPHDTTLTLIVNPNNPNGGIFDMSPLPELLRLHPKTRFLVDEAFIGLAGESVVHLVPEYPNLLVTRTLVQDSQRGGFPGWLRHIARRYCGRSDFLFLGASGSSTLISVRRGMG